MYEPAFGERGKIAQTFYLLANPDGDRESPLYVGLFRVEETQADPLPDGVLKVYGTADNAAEKTFEGDWK